MHATTFLAVLAGSAATLTSALTIPRQAPAYAGSFEITNFKVSSGEHSFDLADCSDGPSAVDTTCVYNDNSQDGAVWPMLTSVPPHTICEDPSVSFSFLWDDNAASWKLTVEHNWGVRQQGPLNVRYENVTDTGSAQWMGRDVHGGTIVTAPPEFTIDYTRYAI
ncbi:hypothetical protein LTR28_006705 [Elasticomyces elasticus]|nr:hypothetical protein LTR28_006705 [Elasticomyces elasticus]